CDLADADALFPQLAYLGFNRFSDKLGTSADPAFSPGLGYAFHLTFAAYLRLELRDQRQYAHDELAGSRRGIHGGIVQHLETDAPIVEVSHDLVEVRCRASEPVELGDK